MCRVVSAGRERYVAGLQGRKSAMQVQYLSYKIGCIRLRQIKVRLRCGCLNSRVVRSVSVVPSAKMSYGVVTSRAVVAIPLTDG
jgi:hypothetical protein